MNRFVCFSYGFIYTILFELIGVLWMVEQTQSQPNHTSYRKFYINRFIANVLRVGHGHGHGHGLGHFWASKLWRLGTQHQFCLSKIHQGMISVIILSLHSASMSQILEPRPQGLISSCIRKRLTRNLRFSGMD